MRVATAIAISGVAIATSCSRPSGPTTDAHFADIRRIVDSSASDRAKGLELLHVLKPGMSYYDVRTFIGHPRRMWGYQAGVREVHYENYGIRIVYDLKGAIVKADRLKLGFLSDSSIR